MSPGAHRRHNPLLDEWVLVSPGRTDRPWLGALEPTPPPSAPEHDPGCYLCPGGLRANGERNPDYSGVHVFANDFPALRPHGGSASPSALFRSEPARGECRVVCYSPRHDLSLGGLPTDAVAAVVDEWCAQCAELGARYSWVQVFENRGEAMGCSNPHPHGQIWALDAVPTLPAREDAAQRTHLATRGRRLLDEVLEAEASGPRMLAEDAHWAWFVPFWASWPFETLLVCKGPSARLYELDPAERASLASFLPQVWRTYDRLFGVPFPFSMGWHGAPCGQDGGHWSLHAHFFPPLLRGPTVRKFMVGFELLAEVQRDFTPEEAAERLRG